MDNLYMTNEALRKGYEESIKAGEMTEDFKKFLESIVDSKIRVRQHWNDECGKLCKEFAMNDLMEHWSKFNPERGNPYGYYSSIIMGAITQGYIVWIRKK